jgi:hypothetical protein
MNNMGINLPREAAVVLYEIIVQLSVRGRVFSSQICFKKCLDVIGIPFRPHSASNIVEEKFQVQVSPILNDHVVKNHTSFHDVNETFLVLKTSWATTTANQACKAPKALSIFFRQASCAFVNLAFFFLGLGMVFKKIPKMGRCPRQDSISLCSHGHSLYSCKP